MAVKRPSPIIADWWTSGTEPDGTPWSEQVMLRGTWPADLEDQINLLLVQAAGDMGIAPEDVDRAFLEAHVVDLFPLKAKQDRLKVAAMVLPVGTSLRYEPTEEQAAAGLPGDEIPFDTAWYDTLASRDRKFILAAIEERSGSIAAKAVAETAGPGLPLASSSPINLSGTSAETVAPPAVVPDALPITG